MYKIGMSLYDDSIRSTKKFLAWFVSWQPNGLLLKPRLVVRNSAAEDNAPERTSEVFVEYGVNNLTVTNEKRRKEKKRECKYSVRYLNEGFL